jgi:hypothetical protein
VDEDSELERVECSLFRLRELFALYREQYKQAYENTRLLLLRRARGFPNAFVAAVYEQTLRSALKDYFRLREQIDWLREQVSQLVYFLTETERREAKAERIFLDESIRERAVRSIRSN